MVAWKYKHKEYILMIDLGDFRASLAGILAVHSAQTCSSQPSVERLHTKADALARSEGMLITPQNTVGQAHGRHSPAPRHNGDCPSRRPE